MNKINNPVQDFLNNKELLEKAQAGEQMFAWKPYIQLYSTMIKGAEYAQIALPLLSISTGVMFLYNAMNSLPVWIAIPFSLLPFCLWEFVKNFILQNAFKSYYSNRNDYKVLAFIAVIFSLGSMFSSVNGARLSFEMMDNKKENTINEYKAIEDSIRGYHDDVINEAKTSRDLFVSTHQIHINNKVGQKFNPKMGKELRGLEQEIKAEKDKKENALKKHEGEKVKALSQAAKDSGFNSWVFIVIAAIIDLFIIACSWFPIYAIYRTTKDYQRLVKSGESVQVLSDSFALALQMMNPHPHPQAMMQEPASDTASIFKGGLKNAAKPIAKAGNGHFKEPLKNTASKASAYRKKYPALCQDLELKNAGNLQDSNAEIAAKHNISEDTLYRVSTSIFAS